MNMPWYKQFWPWFLIALPGAVVIASLITFSLFSANRVSLVSENYYKEGKGINQDLSRLAKSDELKLSANLTINKELATFQLYKGELSQYPPLKITFQHRTHADKDIVLIRNSDATGRYRIKLDQELTGPWFIEMTAFDSTWSLNTRATFPSSDTIALYGKAKG